MTTHVPSKQTHFDNIYHYIYHTVTNDLLYIDYYIYNERRMTTAGVITDVNNNNNNNNDGDDIYGLTDIFN